MNTQFNSADHLTGHAINANAATVARASIHINASSLRVWEVLTDIRSWPRWNADIPKARSNGDLAVGVQFNWKTGGASIRSTLHTLEHGRAVGWTGRTFGLKAIHNWSLVPERNGVRVDVAESMDGLLARWFKASFQRNLEQGMDRWLKALKKECEGASQWQNSDDPGLVC
jgi:uncharacterized protein YndB with AHSA1/START domain